MRAFVATLAACAVFALAGCGGMANSGPPISSVNPVSPSYASLQFAVGTANIYGNAQVGLNVVSTFRQTNGHSATGVNTPTITGQNFGVTAPPSAADGFSDPFTTLFTFTNSSGQLIQGGPSVRESGTSSIFGTPQTVQSGTPACDGPGPFPPAPANESFTACPAGLSANTSTFGQSGGVFAMGLAPYNFTSNTGQEYSLQPYPQPFFVTSDVASNSLYQFVPWGGPPAFDQDGNGMGTRDGLNPGGTDSFGFAYGLGIGEGVTAFDGVKPGTGTYTLSVAISSIGSGGTSTGTRTATAQLSSLAPLPTVTAPVFTPDGNGGGSVTVSLATICAACTEGLLQIVDFGPGGGPNDGAAVNPSNCQGTLGTSEAPVYYTIEITPGQTNYTLPDGDGPNLNTSGGKNRLQPSPSICTAAQNTSYLGTATNGDDIAVQLIGFDYPAYEAAHSLTLSATPENPSIKGANGQADITISVAQEQDSGSTTPSPLKAAARNRLRSRAATIRRIRR
jgi:hypothetical protein